jgi:hypothetical protein
VVRLCQTRCPLLRRATYPSLLHQPSGHDPISQFVFKCISSPTPICREFTQIPRPRCSQICAEALVARGREEGIGHFVGNADARFDLSRISASLPVIGAGRSRHGRLSPPCSKADAGEFYFGRYGANGSQAHQTAWVAHADWTTRFADNATVVMPPATRHELWFRRPLRCRSPVGRDGD